MKTKQTFRKSDVVNSSRISTEFRKISRSRFSDSPFRFPSEIPGREILGREILGREIPGRTHSAIHRYNSDNFSELI